MASKKELRINGVTAFTHTNFYMLNPGHVIDQFIWQKFSQNHCYDVTPQGVSAKNYLIHTGDFLVFLDVNHDYSPGMNIDFIFLTIITFKKDQTKKHLAEIEAQVGFPNPLKIEEDLLVSAKVAAINAFSFYLQKPRK